MTFSNFVCLYMFNLVRAAMELGKNAPGASKGIHNFANTAAFLIRFDRAFDKDHIPNGVKTLVRAAVIYIFEVVGVVGVNKFKHNSAAC